MAAAAVLTATEPYPTTSWVTHMLENAAVKLVLFALGNSGGILSAILGPLAH